MASATASASSLADLATKIYDLLVPLQEDDPAAVFHQQDIFDLDVVPQTAQGEDNVPLMLQVLQKLTNEKLLKLVQDTSVGWMVRSREEAVKWRGLSSEEEVVYGHIDDAGEEGAWTRNIKARSGLHEAVIQAALKKLKGKGMISDMKSVEHPTRKMFIKSSLHPSDRATGGAWYTDNELDEALLEFVMAMLFKFIFQRTFYYSRSHGGGIKKEPKKMVKKITPAEVRAKRDQVLGGKPGAEVTAEGDEESTDPKDVKAARILQYERHLPMPAEYQNYPVLDEMTVWVEKVGAIKATLTAAELQQVLDVMVFDGKIETVMTGPDGPAYRAVRKSMINEDDRGFTLNEVPCGRCPVFELCEEGGPVGPSNCEYFTEWLAM